MPASAHHITNQRFTCDICGRTIRGPGYYVHRKRCVKRGKKPTSKLYPIELPRKLHKGFIALCELRAETLQDGIVRLVKQELEQMTGHICQNHQRRKEDQDDTRPETHP